MHPRSASPARTKSSKRSRSGSRARTGRYRCAPRSSRCFMRAMASCVDSQEILPIASVPCSCQKNTSSSRPFMGRAERSSRSVFQMLRMRCSRVSTRPRSGSRYCSRTCATQALSNATENHYSRSSACWRRSAGKSQTPRATRWPRSTSGQTPTARRGGSRERALTSARFSPLHFG